MGEHNKQFRNIPEAASRSGFREFVQHKATRFGIIAAASLALAACGSQKSERAERPDYGPEVTSPVAAVGVAAEREFVQSAYGGLAIVSFEHLDYSEAHPEDLQKYYGIIDEQRIYEQVLGSLNNQGVFNPALRQNGRPESYLPRSPQPQLQNINEKVAYRLASEISSGLVEDNIGYAIPVNLNAQQAQAFLQSQGYTQSRSCVVALMSESISANEFVRAMTGENAPTLRQIDMADVHRAVAGHEFFHCADSAQDDFTVVGEAKADLYAMARHIQINGNDGFAEIWRDLRTLNYINNGDYAHDTSPLLDVAIPALLEADSRGELDNLNARDLFAKAEQLTARAAETDPENMWKNYIFMRHGRSEALEALHKMTPDADGMYYYDEQVVADYGLALDDEAEADIRNLIAEHNETQQRLFSRHPNFYDQIAHVGRSMFINEPTPEEQAKAFAVSRYRANIQNVIDVQETRRNAYETVGLYLWQEQENERIGATVVVGGLSHAERKMILEEYRDGLAEELGIKQEQQPEREHSIG